MGESPQTLEKCPPSIVLIVDDEALIRWSLAETLTDHGFAVLEAADGSSAVGVLRDALCAVDVVLLDFRLPDSNDLRLLAAIRALSPCSGVVLMTAYSTPDLVAEALGLGAVCVVNKPIEMSDVPGLVTRAHSSAPRSHGG